VVEFVGSNSCLLEHDIIDHSGLIMGERISFLKA